MALVNPMKIHAIDLARGKIGLIRAYSEERRFPLSIVREKRTLIKYRHSLIKMNTKVSKVDSLTNKFRLYYQENINDNLIKH